MKSGTNEARGGVEGEYEFLLWNLQFPVEPGVMLTSLDFMLLVEGSPVKNFKT